ncbi:hypothetical protein TcCL_ESM08943 [Trypanosoma cruzi]|nr:hypothetical protein TcCL_ESM08943 [Trypanosoma cruzi]
MVLINEELLKVAVGGLWRFTTQVLGQPCGNTRRAMDSRRSVPVSVRRPHGREWRTRVATPPARPVRREESHYSRIVLPLWHFEYLFPGEERCQVDAAPVAQQMQSFLRTRGLQR